MSFGSKFAQAVKTQGSTASADRRAHNWTRQLRSQLGNRVQICTQDERGLHLIKPFLFWPAVSALPAEAPMQQTRSGDA
jgi:hypothetical protein